jgi:hypothetical protein
VGRLIRSKAALVVAAAVVGGWLGYSIVGTKASEQAAQTTAVQASQDLAAVCATDPAATAAVGADCPKAQAIAAAQTVDPAVVEPSDGKKGDRGPGVRSTEVRPDGHLLVTYDDGRQVDAGQVVGPGGVGLAAVALTAGHLIVTWTDGRVQDLGQVVGDPARSIASVGQLDDRLIITYDDGTTQDAGALPRGDKGDTGAPGPDCRPGYNPVETGEVVGTDGTRYSRSVTCVDPGSAVQEPEPTPPADMPEGG